MANMMINIVKNLYNFMKCYSIYQMNVGNSLIVCILCIVRTRWLDYFKNHEQFLAKLIANFLVKLINKQSLFEVRPIVFNAYVSLYEKGELYFKTNTKEILENEIFKEQFFRANSLIKTF